MPGLIDSAVGCILVVLAGTGINVGPFEMIDRISQEEDGPTS